MPISISPDGKIILFRRSSPRGDRDVGLLDLERGDEPDLLLHTDFDEHTAMFSPDGRWIAYVSDESGKEEVYLRTFPELENLTQVSTEGGSEPLWSRDGSELFYRSPGSMMAVSVTTQPALSLGRPETLFADHAYRRSELPATSYDVTPDGRRFLMLRTRGNGTPREIVVVINWFEELERLVPTK